MVCFIVGNIVRGTVINPLFKVLLSIKLLVYIYYNIIIYIKGSTYEQLVYKHLIVTVR